MAFNLPNKIILLFTIIVCMAKLNSQPVPGFNPFQVPPSPASKVQKCWSYLEQIPVCLLQIHGSIFNGQFKAISPACCKATAKVDNACWPILFPSHPFFPPLLKSICGHSDGLAAPAQNQFGYLNISKVDLTGAGLLPYQQSNQYGCFSGIESCITGIYRAIFWGRFSHITSGCCQIIVGITVDCLYKLFPFNPFAPTWLKYVCASRGGNHLGTYVTSIPGILPMQRGPEIAKCWSPLTNDESCLVGIYGALSGSRFGLGPACCKAVTEINYNCWPKIFPMNPLFPELLQSFCAHGGVLAPPPYLSE